MYEYGGNTNTTNPRMTTIDHVVMLALSIQVLKVKESDNQNT